MSEETQSSVPMIVVISIAILSILFGLISLCMGGLGVMGNATGIALLEGDMRIMSVVSLALQGINLLACLLLVAGGIAALVSRAKGRFVLAAGLIVLLLADWLIFLGGVGLNVYFMGGDLVPLILGSVLGLVWLVVKSLLYVVCSALLVFLGKGA